MSDFDAEAERERLREKYEAEAESRKRTQQMSELLLKGATMTNSHCGECGSPIFQYEEQTFCPSCQRAVGATDGEAEAGDVDAGAGAGEAEARDANTGAKGGEVEAGSATTGAESIPGTSAGVDAGGSDDPTDPGTASAPAGASGEEPTTEPGDPTAPSGAASESETPGSEGVAAS